MEIIKAMKDLDSKDSNLSNGIWHFVENFRKLLYQLSAVTHIASAEAERKLGEIPLGAGKIAGPIAFSAICDILFRGEAVPMGELTRELRLPPATTNRLVGWWVDNGLAERLRDPKDKRVIKVRITDAGRKFQEISQEIAVARLGPYFRKLTMEEIIIFNLLLDKLTSDIQNGSDD